jgi:hypothetical protein
MISTYRSLFFSVIVIVGCVAVVVTVGCGTVDVIVGCETVADNNVTV